MHLIFECMAFIGCLSENKDFIQILPSVFKIFKHLMITRFQLLKDYSGATDYYVIEQKRESVYWNLDK